MSANVRRLVFDTHPAWFAYSITMWLFVVGMDYLWLLWRPSSSQLTYILTTAMPMMGYMRKAALWRLLPVSSHEIGRAQWWVLLGRPACTLIAGLLIAAAGVSVFGTIKTAPVEIITFLLAQLVIRGLVGLMFPVAEGLHQRFGPYGPVAGWLLLFGACFGATIYWNGHFMQHAAEIYASGLVVTVCAIVLYLFPRLLPVPAAMANMSFGAKTSSPAIPERAGHRHTIRGWAVVVSRFARALSLAGVGMIAIVCTINLFAPDLAAFAVCVFAVFAVTIVAGIQGRMPQRILASLPMPLGARAAIIQLIGPVALTVFDAFLLLAACLIKVDISPEFIVILALTYPVAMAVVSLLAAVSLRFGIFGAAAGSGTMAIMIGAILGYLAFDELEISPAQSLIAIGCAAAVIAASWAWTYWELRSGRHAYRAQALPVRWCGASG